MKPRPKPLGDDLDLDALMDAMTNVVGVLVLVLLMTQLNVQEAVRHIISNSTVTQTDLTEAQKKLEELTQKKETLNNQLDEFNIASERERLARMQDTLSARKKLLEEQKKQQNQFAMKIEDDKKKAEKNEKEIKLNEEQREKLETELTEALKKKADLQARLDKTPVKPAPPPKVVSIPNPRPAPEGAKRLYMVCANNKLYPLSVDDIRKDSEEKSKAIVARYRLLQDPAQGIDPEKFENYFTKLPPSPDEFVATEYFVNNKTWPRIKFVPKENKGVTVDQLMNPRSTMRRFFTTIDPNKFYVVFDVLPDSYDVYLTARQALMLSGIQAGWEPRPQDWVFETSVPNIRLGPPPPPPKNPPAPTPPAKPGNVID
ncbi:MAG TPA: hypothetical protein VNQ76_17400 [Planctomicrobium sp.]|nr:hypothetical protein [Planctomicrobium sp.]